MATMAFLLFDDHLFGCVYNAGGRYHNHSAVSSSTKQRMLSEGGDERPHDGIEPGESGSVVLNIFVLLLSPTILHSSAHHEFFFFVPFSFFSLTIFGSSFSALPRFAP